MNSCFSRRNNCQRATRGEIRARSYAIRGLSWCHTVRAYTTNSLERAHIVRSISSARLSCGCRRTSAVSLGLLHTQLSSALPVRRSAVYLYLEERFPDGCEVEPQSTLRKASLRSKRPQASLVRFKSREGASQSVSEEAVPTNLLLEQATGAERKGRWTRQRQPALGSRSKWSPLASMFGTHRRCLGQRSRVRAILRYLKSGHAAATGHPFRTGSNCPSPRCQAHDRSASHAASG